MSIRAFIRKIAGRAGKASRSNRGANSHVNTQANKRAANKAVRVSHRADLINFNTEVYDYDLINFNVEGTRTGRFYHKSELMKEYAKENDMEFYDYHLDIPDEIKER